MPAIHEMTAMMWKALSQRYMVVSYSAAVEVVMAGQSRSKNGVASLAYVPAIPLRQAWSMAEYYVYFLASRPGGALYVGVTNNLHSSRL